MRCVFIIQHAGRVRVSPQNSEMVDEKYIAAK